MNKNKIDTAFNSEYYALQQELIDKNPGAYSLFLFICRNMNSHYTLATTQKTLAYHTGKTERSIRAYIKTLIDYKLIKKHKIFKYVVNSKVIYKKGAEKQPIVVFNEEPQYNYKEKENIYQYNDIENLFYVEEDLEKWN